MSTAMRRGCWSLLLAWLPVTCTVAQQASAEHEHAGHDMAGHMNDDAIYSMVLLDRLELHAADGETPFAWDASAWIGKDLNRLYLRSEGEAVHGSVERATLEALWSHAVSRWWNLVLGVRHDPQPATARSWLAIGAVGLAPYRINVEATAYVGDAGRTALRLETEYDLLLTNRLILQPRMELNAYGKDDPTRGIGSGISSAEVGIRLRYEIRREVAPYVGVAWNKSFGRTADLRRGARNDDRELQGVVGLRVWF